MYDCSSAPHSVYCKSTEPHATQRGRTGVSNEKESVKENLEVAGQK